LFQQHIDPCRMRSREAGEVEESVEVAVNVTGCGVSCPRAEYSFEDLALQLAHRGLATAGRRSDRSESERDHQNLG